MEKLKMQTANKADENFRKLAEMFPNAVTEVITDYDEDGKAVIERAIDKGCRRTRGALSVYMAGQEKVCSSRERANQQNAPPVPRGKRGF